MSVIATSVFKLKFIYLECECNVNGSSTLQCNRNNGTCVCLEGIGGARCDECARGYLGSAPNCRFCGECFKNWNDILEDLIGEPVLLYF